MSASATPATLRSSPATSGAFICFLAVLHDTFFHYITEGCQANAIVAGVGEDSVPFFNVKVVVDAAVVASFIILLIASKDPPPP